MSTYRFTIFVLALAMQVLLVSLVGATSESAPYGTWLKPIKTPYLAGKATLEFGINVRLGFDTMVVAVKNINNIGYDGPASWVIRNAGSKQYKYTLEVTVPPYDTTGIELEIFVRGISVNVSSLHFVTTGDTLEVTQFWPEPY